jgi:hypothetical protein
MSWLDRPINRGSAVPARKVARGVLLTVGVLGLAIKAPLLLGLAVPSPGNEWLNLPDVTLIAVTCIFAASLLSDKNEPKRLQAVVVAFGALVSIYFVIKHMFGV